MFPTRNNTVSHRKSSAQSSENDVLTVSVGFVLVGPDLSFCCPWDVCILSVECSYLGRLRETCDLSRLISLCATFRRYAHDVGHLDT